MKNITCENCGVVNAGNHKYCQGCGYKLPKIETENTMETDTLSKSKQKIKWSGIFSAIVAVLLLLWIQQLFNPSFDKQLAAFANEYNKICPMMVDVETQLDNILPLPKKTIQYNYRLINLTVEEVVLDTVKKYLEPTIIATIKTQPDMKFLRDNKTTFIYNYRDKNGIFVWKLSVTPDMYE
jgi:hypothetical protein